MSSRSSRPAVSRLAAGVLAALLAAAAHAAPRIAKESLQHEGEARTYHLYVPESLPEEGAPLLLVFHGSRRDGRSLVEKWTKLADEHRFAVAGLDARNSAVWAFPADGPGPVKTLAEALRNRYRLDERRVYLFGHSAGAAFVLKLALIQSGYYAAAAVHAGSFRKPEEFQAIDLAQRKIPLRIIVGDRDAYFPLASVNATVAALEARQLPIELEVVKRHDHWYYDRAHEFNQSAWRFLAAHALDAPPVHVEYRFESPPR